MPSHMFTLDDLEATFEPIVKDGHGSNRWSETFDVVFRSGDKLYHTVVEEGLTEYQDYCGRDRYPDMEYGSDTLECPEVELYEEIQPVTKWRPVA